MALATSRSAPTYLNAERITAREFQDALIESSRTGAVLMVEGQPGVGKSTIPENVMAQIGYSYAFITLASGAPEDIQGIPAREEDRIKRLLLEQLLIATQRPTCLHLDEATCAMMQVQGAVLSLIADRRVGDVKLHPGSFVLVTFNRPGFASGATELSLAFVNRGSHFCLEPDALDVSGYYQTRAAALRTSDPILAKWYALAADLIETAPERMLSFDPPTDGSGTWASPRAVEAMIKIVADLEKHGKDPLTDPWVHKRIRAILGQRDGAVWTGTLIAASKLPSPRVIAANPETAPTATLKDLDLALACVALLPTVIALSPEAAYIWADRFDPKTGKEIRILMNRTLNASGAFPAGGFTGPLARKALDARGNLNATFNAVAAGR